MSEYPEELLRRVASAITDAEAGHLNWDTQARAALDAADYGVDAERDKRRVYVAERGVYAESYVAGVYATAELAMENNADPADEWTQDESGDWDNGQDMGAAVSIYGFDLVMLPPGDDSGERI